MTLNTYNSHTEPFKKKLTAESRRYLKDTRILILLYIFINNYLPTDKYLGYQVINIALYRSDVKCPI